MRDLRGIAEQAIKATDIDHIQVAAYLSTFKNGRQFEGETVNAGGRSAVPIPRQTGMGIIGYRIITVDRTELENAGGKLNDPENPVTIHQESPRYIYRECAMGYKYPALVDVENNILYKQDTLYSGIYLNGIELLKGDITVDREGKNQQEIKAAPKISEIFGVRHRHAPSGPAPAP